MKTIVRVAIFIMASLSLLAPAMAQQKSFLSYMERDISGPGGIYLCPKEAAHLGQQPCVNFYPLADGETCPSYYFPDDRNYRDVGFYKLFDVAQWDQNNAFKYSTEPCDSDSKVLLCVDVDADPDPEACAGAFRENIY